MRSAPFRPPERRSPPEGRSGWLSFRLLGEVIRRLHYGWEALPRLARRRWWTTLGVGFAVSLAITWALVRIASWLDETGALAWEGEALELIITELPLSFSSAMWLEGVGNGFVLWGVMLFAAMVAAWTGKPLRSIAFLVGYTAVYVLVAFGWSLWDRPRPELFLSGLASPGGVFHAFPSGHMVQTSFAYGLLISFWTRAARSTSERVASVGAYVLIVSLVALGRLRIEAHWPTDVIAGTFMGSAWAIAVVVALVSAEREVAR